MRRLALPLVLTALSGALIVEAHAGSAAAAPCALVPLALAARNLPADLHPAESAALGGLLWLVPGLHLWALAHYGLGVWGAAITWLTLSGLLLGVLSHPFLTSPPSLLRTLGLIAAWTCADCARGLSDLAFPTLLGATLVDTPGLSALLAVGGAPLGAAAQAALGLASADVLQSALERRLPTRSVVLTHALTLAALAALAGAGLVTRPALPPPVVWTPGAAPLPAGEHLSIALVQTGVPAWTHQRAASSPALQLLLDAHARALIQQAADARPWGRPPDLIALPESATGRVLDADEAALHALLDGLRVDPRSRLLFNASQRLPHAARTAEHDRRDVAWLLRWAPDADHPSVEGSASKRQMTPGAEPRYQPGPPWRPLTLPGADLGVLICYESLFPHISASYAEQGAGLLVVLSNDAGLGWGRGPELHARLSRARALETGLPLIFVGQAGPTLVVDGQGRRADLAGLFEPGVMHIAVPLARSPGPWAQLHPAWPLLAALGWLAASVARWRAARRA